MTSLKKVNGVETESLSSALAGWWLDAAAPLRQCVHRTEQASVGRDEDFRRFSLAAVEG